MRRLTLAALALGCLLVLPTSSLAEAPSTMSYQGVLTDGGGTVVPDGLYNLTFRLYDVGGGGVALWTENHNNTTVTKGGFSVILGSNIPIALAFDKPYYLSISVNAAPELSPRVPLASSPYGLALRLPYAGTASSANPALSLENSGGPAFEVRGLMNLGTPTALGQLLMYNGSTVSPVGTLYAGSTGGAIETWDENSTPTAVLQPDVDGDGGYMGVFGPTGAIHLNGNYGGQGAPIFAVSGSSNSLFDANATGDASVQLDTDAVNAIEMLNEPGVAQGRVSGFGDITSTSSFALTDIVSVTLEIPTAGYVVVQADAQIGLFGNSRVVGLQLSESSGAALDDDHYFYAGASQFAAEYVPASIHRTYFKTAGSYTFYFQGFQSVGTGAYAWNPTVTATFVPTSYGPVTEAATGPDLMGLRRAHPTHSMGNGPGKPGFTSSTVDLRDLELNSQRLLLAAERAKRELVEAQMRQQMDGARAARAAASKR